MSADTSVPEVKLGHAPVPPVAPEETLFEVDNPTQEAPAVSTDPVAEKPATPRVSTAYQHESVEIIPKKPLPENSYKVPMPSFQLGTFTRLIQQASAADREALESPTRQRWKDTTAEMTKMYTAGDMYTERLSDPEASWSQGIKNGDNLLQFTPPKFKTGDGELKGELALLKVSRALGQGEVLNVPLPHSGIWVTIKPPTERAIINFYNGVFREKIWMGRMTSGLTLSNFSVYINNRLFDFISAHIHSINYGDIDKGELRSYLKMPDFHILASGFAATMYPNGFEYERPCVSDDAKCDYIAKGLINISKLFWVDNNALTDAQRQVMAEMRPGRLTLDHYKKYQLEHRRMVNSFFTVSNGDSEFKVYLRVPTFEEHISDGMAWVNQINGAVDAVIVTDGDEEKVRSELLNQYINSSMLRQFSHYIDYIEVDDSPITDRETLNGVLETFSSDPDIYTRFFEEIIKFKNQTTLALIGVPSYKCPNCHREQNTTPVNEGLVDVIALDVMNLFFTLLTLRMSRILER